MFVKVVSKQELPKLKQEYNIVGMHTQGKKTHIRFLSEIPVAGAEPVEPNIEDAYMLYLWQQGEKIEFMGGDE